MARDVLVVDDEQGIVAVLTRLLSEEGWTVHTALDGTEALRVFRRAKPAVLLIDYVLPGMDGAKLVAALRAAGAEESRLVMMSGLPESMIARKIKHYDAFLRKPFAFEDLLATLSPAKSKAPKMRR